MATASAQTRTIHGGDLASAEPGRVQATLRLSFQRDAATGRTILADSFQEPPLKVVRAFSSSDGSALVHLHNVSGGLLGGDQLVQQIALGSGATVQLTTTGATRIYRRREGLAGTSQCNEVSVGDGALLEYVPDATIPFAGARFAQRTSIHLAGDAGLFWWEIVAPGRAARGEVFAYESFALRTQIRSGPLLIAAENLHVEPMRRDVGSLARFGGYNYLATFYICRTGRDAPFWRGQEERLRESTDSLTRGGEVLWSVSALAADGLVVRCLSRGGREILPGLTAIWKATKRDLYGREAVPPRKVN